MWMIYSYAIIPFDKWDMRLLLMSKKFCTIEHILNTNHNMRFLLSFQKIPSSAPASLTFKNYGWNGTENGSTLTMTRGSKVGPQCQEPTPIVNRYLLSVKDSELCPLPSVNSLQLSHIKPNSFLVTWESPDTNMTGLKGFHCCLS